MEVVVGDLTRPETLADAVAGIDAVVFTHGASGGKAGTEAVDYGGVRNVLAALGGTELRVALMTANGVTNRTGRCSRTTEAYDWKRLVNALAAAHAAGKTFELVAERSPAPTDSTPSSPRSPPAPSTACATRITCPSPRKPDRVSRPIRHDKETA